MADDLPILNSVPDPPDATLLLRSLTIVEYFDDNNEIQVRLSFRGTGSVQDYKNLSATSINTMNRMAMEE